MFQMKLALWFSIVICGLIVLMLRQYPDLFSYSGIWQIIFMGLILNSIVHLFIVVPAMEKHNDPRN